MDEATNLSREYQEYLLNMMRYIERFGGKIIRREGEPCFILSSGMHTRVKYDFERIFQASLARRMFVNEMRLQIYFTSLDVLAGDISMGAFLGEMQHDAFSHTRLILAKKKDGVFVFDENCDLREGDRILLVDDVLTTGKTIVALADALRQWYAEHFSPAVLPRFVGSAVLLDRSSAVIPHPHVLASVPRPLFSFLEDSDSKIYNASECPYHAK